MDSDKDDKFFVEKAIESVKDIASSITEAAAADTQPVTPAKKPAEKDNFAELVRPHYTNLWLSAAWLSDALFKEAESGCEKGQEACQASEKESRHTSYEEDGPKSKKGAVEEERQEIQESEEEVKVVIFFQRLNPATSSSLTNTPSRRRAVLLYQSELGPVVWTDFPHR
jgi:hypothetical protein